LNQLQGIFRSATAPAPATSRRRVPIEIVEDDSRALRHRDAKIATQEDGKQLKDIKDNEFLQPLSSRTISSSACSDDPSSSVKPEQSTIAALPRQTTSTKVQTFKDAKQSRDTTKPSRVGGGIFRSSGNHTLFNRNEEIPRPAPVTTSPPTTVDGTVPKAPMTLFNFTKMWDSHMEDKIRWNILSVCDLILSYHFSELLCFRKFHRCHFLRCSRRRWSLLFSHQCFSILNES
jgi:hypothetical protein